MLEFELACRLFALFACVARDAGVLLEVCIVAKACTTEPVQHWSRRVCAMQDESEAISAGCTEAATRSFIKSTKTFVSTAKNFVSLQSDGVIV